MTEFQPSQEAPGNAPTPPYTPSDTTDFPDPLQWSAAAITGFVLSFLGCTGVGAPLGIVFGIVGLVRTRGGRRRGFGLAVAAIPISLLTGVLFVVIAIGMMLGSATRAAASEVKEVLRTRPADIAMAVSSLREICSEDFSAEVGAEELRAWVEAVRAKHGRLVQLEGLIHQPSGRSSGKASIGLEGKFINGRANITITFKVEGLRRVTVDDIEVDGVSPRGSP